MLHYSTTIIDVLASNNTGIKKHFFERTLSRYNRIRLLIVAFTMIASCSSFALPSDIKQPVKLIADVASYNDKTGVTEYKGNVEIKQGSLKIKAGKLSITLTKNGGIKSAVATGNPASMQQRLNKNSGFAKGQARKINYNAQTGIVYLIGNASLKQDGTSITGNEIKYSLKAGDFEAKRGKNQRVVLTIPPNSKAKGLSIREFKNN